jgi:hypothetical protein
MPRKEYKRQSTEVAENIVKTFHETGQIQKFVDKLMDEAAWYGRFSGRNRYIFQDEVRKALEKYGYI